MTLLLAGIATPQETTDVLGSSYQVPYFLQFAPVPAMIEVVEDRGKTVVVQHAFGKVKIPKTPQRVFVDVQALQTALLLDLNTVGADYYPRLGNIPMHARALNQ
ncbi:MAG: hypothetical protein AAF708_15185 [Deinococcota bacterium]